MADEVEVDTKDLQDTIEEIHREREERVEEEKKGKWTRLIALSTAILAAFGAIAALQSGSLANEGMLHQVQASDTWNEYQSAKQKTHLYGIASAPLLDAHVAPVRGNSDKVPDPHPMAPAQRLGSYLDEIDRENKKTTELNGKAQRIESLAEDEMRHHHQFAYSVALLQVAIALGAVGALTRIKYIWILSMALGIGGIVLFVMGFA